MNGFITAGYGQDELYFQEGDVVFHDKASGCDISDLLETYQRSSLTRELIVAVHRKGWPYHKAIALMGENGALI